MYNGKYVYCFVEGRVEGVFELKGIGGYGKVFFISSEGMTAVVSDTPYVMVEPNRDNALTHEKIIQFFLKSYNLVPCSFGNVFKSKDDVLLFMAKTSKYICENLEKVRGKMEVGLRAFWKKDAFNNEIETKEIKDFRDSLMQRSDSENYYSKIELGKKVEAQVSKQRDYYVDNIFEPLEKHAQEAKLNDTVNPMMVMNAAFLILKEKEQEFDNHVGTVMKKFADRLEFSYSGPWPPYNFTNIVPEA